jgi:uncharacterized integral membrane protein
MLRTLIALPVLIVLILFALSNPQPVTLGFWPTDFKVATPVSAAILVGAALSFLLGSLFVWLPALGVRRRARKFERAARRLEDQVSSLKKKAESSSRTPERASR